MTLFHSIRSQTSLLSRSPARSLARPNFAFFFHFVIGCFDELRFSFSFEQLEITKKQQTHESIMELYLHKIIFVSLLTSLSTTPFIPFLWCFLLIFSFIPLFRLHIAFIWWYSLLNVRQWFLCSPRSSHRTIHSVQCLPFILFLSFAAGPALTCFGLCLCLYVCVRASWMYLVCSQSRYVVIILRLAAHCCTFRSISVVDLFLCVPTFVPMANERKYNIFKCVHHTILCTTVRSVAAKSFQLLFPFAYRVYLLIAWLDSCAHSHTTLWMHGMEFFYFTIFVVARTRHGFEHLFLPIRSFT